MKSLNSPPDATMVATPSTPPKSKFLSVKFTTVLLMAISPLAVQGAVSVTGGAPTTFAVNAYADLGSGFSYTVQNTDSMLVLGFYTDGTSAPGGVTFGGVAPDDFRVSGNRQGIAYWNDPATGSAEFAVSGINGAEAFLAGVYELAGVDLNATVTGTVNGQNDNTIITPTANEFVVSYSAKNGFDVTPGASSIIGLDFGIQSPDGTTTGYLAGGTGLAGAAGSQDVTWDNEDSRGSVTYSFQAVPEPSSAALIGLAGLTLMLRRRR